MQFKFVGRRYLNQLSWEWIIYVSTPKWCCCHKTRHCYSYNKLARHFDQRNSIASHGKRRLPMMSRVTEKSAQPSQRLFHYTLWPSYITIESVLNHNSARTVSIWLSAKLCWTSMFAFIWVFTAMETRDAESYTFGFGIVWFTWAILCGHVLVVH